MEKHSIANSIPKTIPQGLPFPGQKLTGFQIRKNTQHEKSNAPLASLLCDSIIRKLALLLNKPDLLIIMAEGVAKIKW
jgi:hypothetical protein